MNREDRPGRPVRQNKILLQMTHSIANQLTDAGHGRIAPPDTRQCLAADRQQGNHRAVKSGGREIMLLADKVALVTGAGQGIGRAIAVAMAEAGAHVIVADINPTTVEQTASAIAQFQRRTKAIQADVGDLTEIDRMVRETMNEFGRIDIGVHNAGVTRRADVM